MGSKITKRRSRAKKLGESAVAHVARIGEEAVDRANKAAEQYAAASQQSASANVNISVSEVDESFARLAEATAVLAGYVEDIAWRLKPVLREIELPTGAKVERARLLSPMGHKIAQEADEVESACHRLSTLLATLAV